MVEDLNIKLNKYKETFLMSKKYWLVYLVFITITFLSTISTNNIIHPKFEVISFFIVLILGIFCIVYYFLHNESNELYKVAFVIILCFGIICSLTVPIIDVSDEFEHFNHAEILSEGVIFPHWTGDEMNLTRSFTDNGQYIEGAGFESIESSNFFLNHPSQTVFDIDGDTDKINYTSVIVVSAFEQNPFYGYLPQAIGILIAKLLDLNVIWLLWFGRIFNLLCYAVLISYAIKKTPYLKIPILVVSCIPITIYQASSVSIDSLIFGLGILAVSFFIYMCKSVSLTDKDIFKFTIICLLLGLCKLPYLAFIFLLLFIPKNNFKDYKKSIFACLICILFVGIIGILWSRFSQPALLHSWRAFYTNIDSTAQINYFLDHPNKLLTFFKQIFTDELRNLTNGFFNFFSAGTEGHHYEDNYSLITILLQIFLTLALFGHFENIKFTLRTKIGAFFVCLIIYVGTCIIQLLTWSSVGEISLGLSIRYFIPLLCFIPIILNWDFDHKNSFKFEDYTIVLVVGFMATLILAFVTKYY